MRTSALLSATCVKAGSCLSTKAAHSKACHWSYSQHMLAMMDSYTYKSTCTRLTQQSINLQPINTRHNYRCCRTAAGTRSTYQCITDVLCPSLVAHVVISHRHVVISSICSQHHHSVSYETVCPMTCCPTCSFSSLVHVLAVTSERKKALSRQSILVSCGSISATKE